MLQACKHSVLNATNGTLIPGLNLSFHVPNIFFLLQSCAVWINPILQDMLRHIFQSCILESNEEILELVQKVPFPLSSSSKARLQLRGRSHRLALHLAATTLALQRTVVFLLDSFWNLYFFFFLI